MNLHHLGIAAAHELLEKKEITSVELTRAVLDRIDAVEDKVQAYLTVTADRALAQAKEADRLIAGGNGGPLTGIPLGVKDLSTFIH